MSVSFWRVVDISHSILGSVIDKVAGLKAITSGQTIMAILVCSTESLYR